MDSQALFTRTPPVRLFFLAAIPGSISMLASSLYYTLDGIFVGQFIGATAFAAINLAMPFVIINFSLADLVGVGSSVPISICLGRGEQKEANNIFTCAVLLILALGAAVGAALCAAALASQKSCSPSARLTPRPSPPPPRSSVSWAQTATLHAWPWNTCASTPSAHRSPRPCSPLTITCASPASSAAACGSTSS